MRARLPQIRSSRRLLAVGAAGTVAVALSLFATLLATGQDDLPYGVTVSNSTTIFFDPKAGEVQSTVVPPGANQQCPEGRLLVSNDNVKDPAEVVSLALDNMNAKPTKAQVADPLGWGVDRRLRSNDHDLIALPNGEVLLLKMGQAKYELANKPVWFDHAYKLSYDKDGNFIEAWGPGARSEIFVWRSVDCGDTFEFISAIDTAQVDDAYGTPDDGSGGLPQSDNFETVAPGSQDQPVWQMGGTDGPLTRVDPSSGDVFITLALVGNLQSPVPGFYLSDELLNRTVVMRSSDKGSTWQHAAVLPFSDWRLDVVPREGKMAFADQGWNEAANEGSAFITPDLPFGFTPTDGIPFSSSMAPQTTGKWGWNQSPWTHPVLYRSSKNWEYGDSMAVNIPGQTLLTRSPSSKNLLIAYMDTISNLYDGYRLYMFDGQSSWLSFQPIVPETLRQDDFILHPTAVDPGRGPVMFYWYDVDTVEKTATIRGRLITRDNGETVNFPISQPNRAGPGFDVSPLRWYGDYHTAGAYFVESTAREDWTNNAYHYYPIWLQGDGDVRVAHVTYGLRPEESQSLVDYFGHVVRPLRTILRQQINVFRLLLSGGEEERDGSRLDSGR